MRFGRLTNLSQKLKYIPYSKGNQHTKSNSCWWTFNIVSRSKLNSQVVFMNRGNYVVTSADTRSSRICVIVWKLLTFQKSKWTSYHIHQNHELNFGSNDIIMDDNFSIDSFCWHDLKNAIQPIWIVMQNVVRKPFKNLVE